jgi:hypothetical protein
MFSRIANLFKGFLSLFISGLHEPANQDGQGLRRHLTLQAGTGDPASDSRRRLKPEAVTTARNEARLQICINALVDGSDNLLAILGHQAHVVTCFVGYSAFAVSFGAVVGTAVAVMPWARWAACIGGSVWGVFVAVAQARYAQEDMRFVVPRFQKGIDGIIGLVTGAVQGAFFGIMAVAFVGAVLGGIVLSSILGLFNFAEFKRYYAQRKTDFALACTALVGVAASDVMTGLMLAVFLSVVMLLYRASRPYIAILGRRANGEYSDLDRHPDAQSIPGLVMLRLDAPLYFFNANVARSQILEQRGAASAPQAILLAVGSDDRPEWDLDTLEATVLETLELAKLRTVDLTALAEAGQFLPALYFAHNAAGDTIATDFRDHPRPTG